MTAEEHIQVAEGLLAAIPMDQAGRRQGFDDRHANAAVVAQAHASLALALLAQKEGSDA